MGNRIRRDRLSDLPLSIIHEILARVPMIDAIRTSFLSRQWRYTWTTLPRLSFDGFTKKYTRSTENFVSNVLLHHKGPIHRFEMYNFFNTNFESIEEWMLCLSKKDIRELAIHLAPDKNGDMYALKPSIYSCLKLTRLELGSCTLHPPPSSFNGFMALTALDILQIELPDGVENLVASCPLLETLTMEYCSCSEIRICSPNLKDLHLNCEFKKLCLYAPLLAKMYAYVELSSRIHFTPEAQTLVCNYTNIFGCFTNLVKLNGHSHFIQYLSIGIETCHHTLVLHHLSVIKLTGVNFADRKEVSVVARLIIGAPNLHKLRICTSPIRDGLEAQYVLFKDFGCESNFTLEKQRDVSLYGVCEYFMGMHFIKFLLESSPVLETINLDYISRKAATELLGLRRSSTNARILLRLRSFRLILGVLLN